MFDIFIFLMFIAYKIDNSVVEAGWAVSYMLSLVLGCCLAA